MNEDIKIARSLLKYSISFCKENGIKIDNTKLNINSAAKNDVWYDYGYFKIILTEIETQKNSDYIETLGKEYLKILIEKEKLKDIFEESAGFKNVLNKMHTIFQLFIKAKRIGIWKTEVSHSEGFLTIKENTFIPPEFTKGILYAIAENYKLSVVNVKLKDKIEDEEDTLNIYEIIWMNKLKNPIN